MSHSSSVLNMDNYMVATLKKVQKLSLHSRYLYKGVTEYNPNNGMFQSSITTR